MITIYDVINESVCAQDEQKFRKLTSVWPDKARVLDECIKYAQEYNMSINLCWLVIIGFTNKTVLKEKGIDIGNLEGLISGGNSTNFGMR